MKTFLKFFIKGLILFIPVALTVIVFVKIYDFFQGLFSFVGFTGIPFVDTFISLLCLIVVLTFLGILASSFIFRHFFTSIEKAIEHTPVIRHIYLTIKDFMNAFTGSKKKFTKPVLVLTNPHSNIQELGFITNNDLSEIGIEDKVSVYMPMSFSFAGRMIIVPKQQITPLNIDGGEAMKFVVSGGITDVD